MFSTGYEIEQNSKTLAGSVSYDYPYSASVIFDGEDISQSPNGVETVLCIYQRGKNQIVLELSRGWHKEYPVIENGAVRNIETSLIVLQGKAADVTFDQTVELEFTNMESGSHTAGGKVSGWLKNPGLIAIWTKTDVSQFDLDGEVRIEWQETSGLHHTLFISNIKAQ